MNKRYAVLGLSIFLALALAVPALGGPSNPVANISASAKQIANKALKKAKTAQSTAESAQGSANNAQSTADKALTEAKKAQTTGSNAQTSANTAKAAADSAKAAADSAAAAAAAAEANANNRIKSTTQVIGELSAESTTTPKFASVSCPSGSPVTGGGYSMGGESNRVTVRTSEEQLYGGGWFVAAETINGQAGASWSILAVAVCGTK